MRRVGGVLAVLVVLAAAWARWGWPPQGVEPMAQRLRGRQTIADRMRRFGPTARGRWAPFFARAGVAYPPERLVLLGLKRERRLEVYAASAEGSYRFVRAYPILGASGGPGPKLREGDRQVPEGVYAVESLNPNSAFHLSLRLGYPNLFDREMARREGREQLGSDIMIHGGRGSAGCLAMGDKAAEDLFVLAADTGIETVCVILSPCDLRRFRSLADRREWVRDLYREIREEMERLPRRG